MTTRKKLKGSFYKRMKRRGYAIRSKAKKKAMKMILNQVGNGTFKGSKRQRGKTKTQRGGFGGALAAGMLIPQLLSTTGKILKISV